MNINEFRIGDFEATLIQKDIFALDGGAMFGTVPKNLWSRKYQSDDQNRIDLSGSILFVNANGRKIIVETGIGSKYSEKEKEIFKIRNIVSPDEALSHLNLKPEDIDIVILTHLHFDHAGGSTVESEGEIIPVYENAKYIVQRDEFKAARNPNERTEASYRAKDFEPLNDSGNLVLIDGEEEISEGVKVMKTGGHSKGHQVVFFESNNEKLLHIGDIVPTSVHLPLPYIMAYDICPLDTLDVRKDLYRKAIEEEMSVVFSHDLDQKVIDSSEISSFL